MVKRNVNFSKLQTGYLFPEIAKRRREFVAANPQAKLISLGIGNTTEPLTTTITKGLVESSQKMGTPAGYSGYGDDSAGETVLRKEIAKTLYNNLVNPEDVFVSDGSKCDIGRLQVLFGKNVSIAVQDPAYPVYVDGSKIMGAENIVYMSCKPENNFFPDLKSLPRADLIYFCSPNNPTGAVATKEQLQELVAFAKKNKSIIIFDAAYREFITDPTLPKTIYEIPGAKEVAIETNSFSKSIGFTGVRLGWAIVPQELKYEDGSPVSKDWQRVINTLFNGASNIVQAGGLVSFTTAGLKETKELVSYYLENARIIREGLNNLGIKTYGGVNAPYIWAHFPNKKSWDVFDEILNKCHVVTTPGAGFGAAGEGFVRFSCFGHRENVVEAVERLKKIKL
jgi:LL-diaminopimelate aminotransferase